jgi:DNA-binding response OmpR family regulator
MMGAFADPLRCLSLSKRLETEGVPIDLDWRRLTARELLETIATLIASMGPNEEMHYDALYILVDCVDETRAGPEAAVPLLEPLIRERPLLEMPKIAFKFFLPLDVGARLQQRVTLRSDRLYIHTITWEKNDLTHVIQQRFNCYHHDPSKRLEDICTPSAKHTVMDRLIKESQGSPRTLLRLCRALFQHHVRRTDRPLINSVDISDTIAEFRHRLEVEARGAVPVTGSEEEILSIPQRGLCVGSGHVWVDGEKLEPPLSPQEFDLLKLLYDAAPEIVSHEQLIAAVWPESDWMSEGDQAQFQDAQNLRKLVSRLRSHLTYVREDRELRFVKNVRGRGYWLDVQGDPA